MAILGLTECAVQRVSYVHARLPHKIAPLADLAVGLALLAVSILGMYQVISMPSAVTYGLFGAGAAYTVIMGILIGMGIKKELCPHRFLFTHTSTKPELEG